ncbi:MAG TPA: methyltransferase domain-containing protein [Alphaproteobacteria bacterium]|nr:methyltransferase domain-containing protein [Alphaproteobacteria bacterium]
MSPDQTNERDVTRMMAELRADSAAVEGFSVIPREARRPIGAQERSSSVVEQSVVRGNRSSVSLEELLALEGDEFVNRAYLEILGRRPDLEGFKFYSGQLAKGRVTKIEILDALQRSGEGRKRGRAIEGLGRRARLYTLFRLPVIGYVLRMGWLIVSLPRMAANLRAFETHVRVQLAGQAAQLQSADRARTDQFRALKAEMERARIDQASRLAASQRESEERLRARLTDLWDGYREEMLQNLARGEERITGLIETLNAFRAALNEEINPLKAQVVRQGAGLLDQERRLTILLEEARRRLPEPFDARQLAELSSKADHMLDRLYLMIEDRFRGTRADIKSRQRIYVEDARRAADGAVDQPLVDLGCGRGEWLELLRDEGLPGLGVDMNDTMIEKCREVGLEVVQSEALDFLRARPPASVSAITGFHIIEHMPFAAMIALVDEALRALRPGGLLLFETPNPENILVSTHNFYMDPTHLRPLPSILVSALLEARGFVRVEVRDLHPHPNAANWYDPEVLNDFNRRFYGPQDYAVLAWKPLE